MTHQMIYAIANKLKIHLTKKSGIKKLFKYR